MPDRQIPYWIERVASEFRATQRGEIAPDESIEEARRIMNHQVDEAVSRGNQKRRKTGRRVQP